MGNNHDRSGFSQHSAPALGAYPGASPARGVGCLAWIGILCLVGFAMLFTLCVGVVAVATLASDPLASDPTDPSAEPASSDDESALPLTGAARDAGGRPAQCTDGAQPMPRPASAAIGKAGTLSGRICAVEIFVSGGTSSWTPRDRKEELESATKGYAFLKRQAARYGQHVEVVEVVEPGELHLDTLKVDAMSGWVTVPMGALQAKLGRSLDAMVDASRTLHGCKSAHVVLHVVPESSVSHAEPGPGAEFAVVSHRDWAVLAHEVLHLYGAWDFYHVPGLPSSPQPRQRAEELERMFPGEVMGELRGTPNVGALTAWLVGWSSCAKPSYPSFRPSA